MTDITAVLTCHREQLYLVPAIESLRVCCERARAAGLSVEILATIDRGDALTKQILDRHSALFDAILTVDFGDLGASRNHATNVAKGEHIAFFDGDDMWGDQWLVLAHAAQKNVSEAVVWHPEYAYFFFEDDPNTSEETPHSSGRAHAWRHVDSSTPGFDPRACLIENVYTAHVFARRSFCLAHPYERVDPEAGYAFEDWWWHLSTLAKGVRHGVVAGAVHVIRKKQSGSLANLVAGAGFVPPVATYGAQLLAARKRERADGVPS